MRLVYALILCAGFKLDWHWYALAFAVWAAGMLWTHFLRDDIAEQSPAEESCEKFWTDGRYKYYYRPFLGRDWVTRTERCHYFERIR